MANFLSNLFRRRKSSHNSNKDPSANGILSTSSSVSVSSQQHHYHHHHVVGKQQQQPKKKLSKRQLKKQMKKDRLAHFPTTTTPITVMSKEAASAAVGMPQAAAAAAAAFSATCNPRPDPPSSSSLSSFAHNNSWEIRTAEEHKENSRAATAPYSLEYFNSNINNNSHPNSYENFYNDDLYDVKPVLSMIAEEKSPKHHSHQEGSGGEGSGGGGGSSTTLISPTASAVSGASGTTSNSSRGSGSHLKGGDIPLNSPGNASGSAMNGSATSGNGHLLLHHHHQHQQHHHSAMANNNNNIAVINSNFAPIISPMSGNKPPLTPNRLLLDRAGTRAGGGGGGGLGTTPSSHQFRSPNSNNSLSSPDDQSSLRGIRIAHSEDMIMCLSPDDEEDEYTRLSRKENTSILLNNNNHISIGGTAGSGNGMNGGGKEKNLVSSSASSPMGRSPFGYHHSGELEDDNDLFPALVEDKDPWNQHYVSNTTNATGSGATASRGSNHHHSKHDGGTGMELNILPMAHETQEDIRAWTPSPTKKYSFTFQGGPMMSSSSPSMNASAGGSGAGTNGNVDNNNSAHPQQNNVLFENFADFEPFDPSPQFHNVVSKFGKSSSSKSVSAAATAFNTNNNIIISPVSSELLVEDSRARRKTGPRSIGESNANAAGFLTRSSGSINSAPLLNSSQTRNRPNNSNNNMGGAGRTSSMSRVIDNLELHVNKRQGLGGVEAVGGGTKNTAAPRSHSSVTSHHSHSQHSMSGSGVSSAFAIREAKERIRRENMMNQESKVIDMLAAGGSSAAAATNNNINKDNWLFDEVAGTLGPRSVAADLESLGGRSNKSGKSHNTLGGKSHRSARSLRSRKSRSGDNGGSGAVVVVGGGGGGGTRRHRSSRTIRNDDGVSVDSRTSQRSRNSYRSYQTTKSMVSQMSEQSRSVANDLLRLEAQLSMVGKSRNGGSIASSGVGAAAAGGSIGSTAAASSSVISKTELNKRRDDCGMTVTSHDFSVRHGKTSSSSSRGGVGAGGAGSSSRDHISASARRAAMRTLRSKVTVIAPPGKLGIILANRTDSHGTVVSGVRTSSVLAEQVSPGDRIIEIDDEDVSQMNVKEITTIMSRKCEFERVLVLLAAPKAQYD